VVAVEVAVVDPRLVVLLNLARPVAPAVVVVLT
jgi:hypothetical protein